MNTNIGKAIKRLRQQRGWSLQQLSDAMGGSPDISNISRVEKLKQAPTFSNIDKFAKALGVRVVDLINEGEGGAEAKIVTTPVVPWVPWKDLDLYDADLTYMASKNNQWVPAHTADTDHLFASTVVNNAMQQESGISFPEGYTLIFSRQTDQLKSGDFVLALDQKGGIVFRQFIQDGSSGMLIALNKNFLSIPIDNPHQNIIAICVHSQINL